MNKYCRSIATRLAGLACLIFAGTAVAQTAVISQGVPAQSLLGEQFCFETNFQNTGDPGFGPYLRLELPPELSLDSALLFTIGTEDLVTDLGLFPGSGELEDSNIEQPVTGTPGNRLLLITLPIGAVVDDGPDLPIRICLTIDPGAEFDSPIPINLTPAYAFGDTPTGENGPIIGTTVVQNVTPTVLTFEKSSSAPESERPPGASWPYTYTLTANIANGATISPLRINDTLPPDFQYLDGSISITGTGTCAATTLPPTLTPGGELEVECTGTEPGVAGASEFEVTYAGYITDVLSEASCSAQDIINLANASGEYLPPAGDSQPVMSEDATTTVSAQNMTIQQSVAPTAAGPGDPLVYGLSIQVTEFGTGNALVVTDTLPDGVDYVSHAELLVGGVLVPITATVVVNGDFTKTVTYDIAAAATTALVSIDSGSSISLSYNARLRDDYQSTGERVLSGDSLTATQLMNYGLTAGAANCENASAATVSVAPVSITKELINPQDVYRPGDIATFRLTQTIPAGSTSDIRFTDFLPIPVFDVADIDPTFGGSSITRGPQDNAGLTPSSIAIRASVNALDFIWPDLESDVAQIIQVDIAAVVTDAPYADGLFLTNIFQTQNSNTADQTETDIDIDSLNIGAPELSITKGVSATIGNGVITPSPAVLPIDGDISGVDANDAITFVLTVENSGNAPAHEVLITDPGVTGLTACTINSVTDGLGDDLDYTGNLVDGIALTNALSFTDGTPGESFGTDTALVTFTCTVVSDLPPASNFTNTADVTWASLPGAERFPAQMDSATVASTNTAIEKLYVISSEAGTSDELTPPRATIGEIVRYRLIMTMPEGRIGALSFVDDLPNSLLFLDDGTTSAVFVSNGPGLSSSTLGIPNLDEPSAQLDDLTSDQVSFLLPASAISGGPFGVGDDPGFELGDILNADSDSNDEFVVVEFNAVMRNVNAVNRDNTFAAFADTDSLNGDSNSIRVSLAEPQLSISKTADPAIGDAGDTVSFTITLGNANNNAISPAYDVSLEDILPAGLINATDVMAEAVDSDNCNNLVISDNTVGDSLQFGFSEISPDCQVRVTFDATLTDAVAPGTAIENLAEVEWTSLPGENGTILNPTGSATPGDPGNDTGERDASDGDGGVNDYQADAVAAINIPGVGIEKSVIRTDQDASGTDQGNAALFDLLIGEQATFQLIATLPEGLAPSLIITDTLPFTNGVMRVDAARVISVGAKLTADNPNPAADISDVQLDNDGIDDTVSFDFGEVFNDPDVVSDDEDADQVIIEIDATLINTEANVNTDTLTNTVLVQFGEGLNGSSSASVDVVEPILTIDKSGSISQGDAGDDVFYTITISNTGPPSRAIAQDLTLIDTLPPDLELDLTSIAVTPDFDVDLSSGNTISLGWANLPIGGTIELTYTATLLDTVQPGQSINNTASLEWTSLPGADDDERTNSASNDHVIEVTPPGVTKIITGTTVPGTESEQFGPPDDLTIGEEVTYQFTVRVPEGTSTNVEVFDQLPDVFQLLSSRLISVGSSLTMPDLTPLLAPGTPGTPSDNNNDDAIDDRATWVFGDILNTPDDTPNADDDLVFEVVAVVLDLPANQSGNEDLRNLATVVSDTATVSGNVGADLVAPLLALEKSVLSPVDGFVDGGDTVEFLLTISHVPGTSTADAYNLVVEDTLPDGVTWAGDAEVSSLDCPDLFEPDLLIDIDSTGEPVITFSFDELPLADGSCDIRYEVVVDDNVVPGQQLQNSAMLSYDSTPVFTEGRTRQGMSAAVADVVVLGPTLLKTAVSTSQPGTGFTQGDSTLRDLAIGETVTYQLTLLFPEVLVTNAVLVDTMPASASGIIEVIGASILSVGGVSTTLPGTPVLSDELLNDSLNDTVTIDFGDVSNASGDDGELGANTILVQVTGRVVDLPANVNGTLLTNVASFTSDVGNLEDTATVEVVEPVTDLTKNMTLLADGLVRISLAVENTGTAPAYDIQVNDILDEADWQISEFSQVSVSPGFEILVLADTPAVGQSTIRLQNDPLAVLPAGAINPGASISAVFDVPLAVLPPDPNPLPNLATQDAGDSLPGDDDAARDLPADTAEDSIAVPQLRLLKTAALLVDANDSGAASPGDTLRYTLVLENIGEAAATNVSITDVPDGFSTLVAGSVTTTSGSVSIGNTGGDTTIEVLIPSVLDGASVTITYDTTVNDPLPVGIENVVNQADFNSVELPPGMSDDPNDPNSDMDPTVVPLDAAPDLVIVKDDGLTQTTPGGELAYTLDYANEGDQDATGVTIIDTVPANTSFNAGASSVGWLCVGGLQAGAICSLDIGDLAAGETGSVVFAVTVDSQVPAAVENIANTASINDDGNNGEDPTPDNNSDSDIDLLIAQPDLTIIKDDGDATAVPGQLLSWSLLVSNVGNQGATEVIISDVVPANTTFSAAASTAGWVCTNITAGSACSLALGNLTAGASISPVFTVLVDTPLPAGVREVANAASVADDGSNGDDPTPDNNMDDDTAPVTSTIDIAITKTDSVVIVEPDDLLVYTLGYQNLGNQGVTGVTISEVVPDNTRFVAASSAAGWSCDPDGEAGSSCTFTLGGLSGGASGALAFAVQLLETLPETVTEILNSASIADDGSNGQDINLANNVDDEDTPADVRVELGLVKSLSNAPDPIAQGDVIEYTLVATNLGNSVLTNVVVSDNLITPTGGTTPCERLEPLEECTLIGTYEVTLADMNRGFIPNTGTADSDQTDPIDDELLVPLVQEPGIQLIKLATLIDENGNELGDNREFVEYELLATNTGNVTLSNVLISDPLLTSLSCRPGQPAVLDPGEELACSGRYQILFRDTLNPVLVNTATVRGTAPAGDPVTDRDRARIPLDQYIPVPVPVMSPAAMVILMLLMLGGAVRYRYRPNQE